MEPVKSVSQSTPLGSILAKGSDMCARADYKRENGPIMELDRGQYINNSKAATEVFFYFL